MVSAGASDDVDGALDDEPTCRHTTVPVSSHAARSGSQYPVCNDGSPRRSGSSGNVIARNPRAAFARTSAAATSGSSSHGTWHGMIRPGYVPAHSSWCQSFAARTTASASSGSDTPSW